VLSVLVEREVEMFVLASKGRQKVDTLSLFG